jgi:hypothetical protein
MNEIREVFEKTREKCEGMRAIQKLVSDISIQVSIVSTGKLLINFYDFDFYTHKQGIYDLLNTYRKFETNKETYRHLGKAFWARLKKHKALVTEFQKIEDELTSQLKQFSAVERVRFTEEVVSENLRLFSIEQKEHWEEIAARDERLTRDPNYLVKTHAESRMKDAKAIAGIYEAIATATVSGLVGERSTTDKRKIYRTGKLANAIVKEWVTFFEQHPKSSNFIFSLNRAYGPKKGGSIHRAGTTQFIHVVIGKNEQITETTGCGGIDFILSQTIANLKCEDLK